MSYKCFKKVTKRLCLDGFNKLKKHFSLIFYLHIQGDSGSGAVEYKNQMVTVKSVISMGPSCQAQIKYGYNKYNPMHLYAGNLVLKPGKYAF